MLNDGKIEEFLNEVNELLNEIKNEQTKLTENVEQYHKINMRNFEKLKDFNEICDMTNQIFEKTKTKKSVTRLIFALNTVSPWRYVKKKLMKM